MIASRALAVLSAVCMVGAFALATLLPPLLTLGQAIRLYDVRFLFAIQQFVVGLVGDWGWLNIVLPLMNRPSWLPVASLGIILAGAAMTVASRPGVPRSHRRRS